MAAPFANGRSREAWRGSLSTGDGSATESVAVQAERSDGEPCKGALFGGGGASSSLVRVAAASSSSSSSFLR